MKKSLLTISLAFAVGFALAQTVLTEKTHGLLPGNPNPMILTESNTPGVAGQGVVWDFSALPQKAAFYGSVEAPETFLPPTEANKCNTLLKEGDLEAFMTTNSNELRVLANRVQTYVCSYEQPVTKMRYPFSYGDEFAGETGATIYYTNSDYRQHINLSYNVKADAYGTLLLPGTTLKDVLRVATTQTRKYSEYYTSTVITYRWYVKSHRFPVLSLIYEKRENGDLVYLQGAYNPVIEASSLITQTDKENSNGKVTTLNLYPNPFSATLNVNYSLNGKSNVTIALYNAQGMLVKTLLQHNQEEGSYTNAFDVQNMTAGLYVLRVEASGSVLSQQIIKVE